MEDFTRALNALNLLSAMITPAVLISACGTLVISTSARLARIVDRTRELSRLIEEFYKSDAMDFRDERRAEFERQLAIHARRSQLVQRSLTSYYVALSLFVAATVAVGFTAVFKLAAWLPNLLGIVGTLFLFYGCLMLMAETRLALRSVKTEMEFTLLLRAKYEEQRTAVKQQAAGR